MTVPEYNFVWQQGEDAVINMVYKVNNEAVDLTGYQLRMDVVGTEPSALYTFNTDDSDEQTHDEAVVNESGEIHIELPRSVTLSGGDLYNTIGQVLTYDVFLRDTNNKQRKILKGTVTIEASNTLWS